MLTLKPVPVSSTASLFGAVQAHATGLDSIAHGASHLQRVAHAGIRLARMTPGADDYVAFTFGLLHDTMRLTDGHDPHHGARAATFAKALHGDGLLPLSHWQLELLTAALESHDRGLLSDDPTIGCCWDADRLDLWRFGTMPLPALLSTKHAPVLISWARRRPPPPPWAELVPWDDPKPAPRFGA